MWISAYRSMWLIVCFDLPTDTPKARKQYAIFRKNIMQDGFNMMQYSIYYRHCSSKENTTVHLQRIRNTIPPDGEVRILQFTDKQFERMETYSGKRRTKNEAAAKQLEMF